MNYYLVLFSLFSGSCCMLVVWSCTSPSLTSDSDLEPRLAVVSCELVALIWNKENMCCKNTKRVFLQDCCPQLLQSSTSILPPSHQPTTVSSSLTLLLRLSVSELHWMSMDLGFDFAKTCFPSGSLYSPTIWYAQCVCHVIHMQVCADNTYRAEPIRWCPVYILHKHM